jgi:hypothetical protein
MSSLRQSIVNQICEAIDDVLANVPASISESRRNEIRDDAVEYSQRVVEACSTEELKSDRAFERFMETAIAQVRTALPKCRQC